ncbi:MAG: signal peptide peptidase SppA [Candidatus Aenigmatarchaeota archaeon]
MKFPKLFWGIAIGVVATVLLLALVNLPEEPGKPKVAVIPIQGAIQPGSAYASPSYVRSQINKAEDENAAGFLFDINSPGGTVVGSKKIAEEIEKTDSPSVCLLQDVAASGAYWVTSSCDHVVSDPLTLTGSIGIRSSYLEYSEHMEEEGIEHVRLVKGEHKDMGSPYRNLTEREREMFIDSLNKIYSYFLEDLKENRNLTEDEIENVSDGRTILGEEAKEIGLVDQLGGREEAKEWLENQTGKEIAFKEYERKISFFDIFELSEESKAESLAQSTWSKSAPFLATAK